MVTTLDDDDGGVTLEQQTLSETMELIFER